MAKRYPPATSVDGHQIEFVPVAGTGAHDHAGEAPSPPSREGGARIRTRTRRFRPERAGPVPSWANRARRRNDAPRLPMPEDLGLRAREAPQHVDQREAVAGGGISAERIGNARRRTSQRATLPARRANTRGLSPERGRHQDPGFVGGIAQEPPGRRADFDPGGRPSEPTTPSSRARRTRTESVLDGSPGISALAISTGPAEVHRSRLEDDTTVRGRRGSAAAGIDPASGAIDAGGLHVELLQTSRPPISSASAVRVRGAREGRRRECGIGGLLRVQSRGPSSTQPAKRRAPDRTRTSRARRSRRSDPPPPIYACEGVAVSMAIEHGARGPSRDGRGARDAVQRTGASGPWLLPRIAPSRPHEFHCAESVTQADSHYSRAE